MKNFLQIPVGALLLALSTNAMAGPGDTLGVTAGSIPQFAPGGSVSLITLGTTPGYFYGTFWPADFPAQYSSIAQVHTNSEQVTVVGVIVRPGAKRKGSNTNVDPMLTVKLHNFVDNAAHSLNGTAISPTPDIPGPSSTVLGTATLSFEAIDTSGYNVIPMVPPVAINADVVVSLDLAAIANNGDTLGFWSDQPGDGMGLNYSFHKLTAGTASYWLNSSAVGGVAGNTNIAIFVILDAETAIENASLIQGLKAAAYPNPSSAVSNISYSTEKAGNMNLEILAADGKLVLSESLGYKSAGSYIREQYVSGLPSGTYIFSISHEDGSRYTQRMIVSH